MEEYLGRSGLRNGTKLHHATDLKGEIYWGEGGSYPKSASEQGWKRKRASCEGTGFIKDIVLEHRENMPPVATVELYCIWQLVMSWELVLSY